MRTSKKASLIWYALYDKHLGAGKVDGLLWGGVLGGGWYIVAGIALVVGGMIVTYFSFTVLFVTMDTI